MVLVLHQAFGCLGVLVIKFHGFVNRKFHALVVLQFQLNQCDNAIIDNPEILTADIFSDFTDAFRFKSPDALRLDEDLIGETGNAKHSPGSTVILQFPGEDVPALSYTCVVFSGSVTHTLIRMAQDTDFTLPCGYLELDLTTPVVMGILNVTPDSFFDGGKYNTSESALLRAEQMVGEGAVILDLGAASSRPGAAQPSSEEEWGRLRPVLEEVRGAFPSVIISIDTYRSEIAQRAIDRGANIINDIFGGEMDKQMFTTIVKNNAAYVCMHMQGTPENMQKNPQYSDVVNDVHDYFTAKLKTLHNSGVENVIIDPGFGFGKEVHHNYQLMKNLEVFSSLGKPLLAGVSRKSMITRLLDISKDEALNGTTALHMVALQKGAKILRVHDVREAVECIRIHGMIE